MSWSISFIGKPENVAAALMEESGKLSGQSKIEFDAARDSLITLVNNNFAVAGSNYTPPLIKLTAGGSGSAKTIEGQEPQQMQRSCTVLIEPFYSKLL